MLMPQNTPVRPTPPLEKISNHKVILHAKRQPEHTGKYSGNKYITVFTRANTPQNALVGGPLIRAANSEELLIGEKKRPTFKKHEDNNILLWIFIPLTQVGSNVYVVVFSTFNPRVLVRTRN